MTTLFVAQASPVIIPSGLTHVLIIAGVIVAALGFLANSLSNARRGYSSPLSFLGPLTMGASIAAAPFALNTLPNLFASMMSGTGDGSDADTPVTDTVTGQASASPTPSAPSPVSSTSTTPSPSSSATHAGSTSHTSLPWGWLLFIAVCALALLVIAVIGYFAWARAREHAAERKRRAEVRAEVEYQWSVYRTRLENITKRWDSYESDPEKFLTQPAIRDVSIPEVAAAIRALMTATGLNTRYPEDGVTTVANTPFARAVTEAEQCVDAAIRTTRSMVDTSMTAEERKLLHEAQQYLRTALNSGATPAERKLNYDRMRRILDRLDIVLPATVVSEIETKHLKLIAA